MRSETVVWPSIDGGLGVARRGFPVSGRVVDQRGVKVVERG
jgi:hypothetical protein